MRTTPADHRAVRLLHFLRHEVTNILRALGLAQQWWLINSLHCAGNAASVLKLECNAGQAAPGGHRSNRGA